MKRKRHSTEQIINKLRQAEEQRAAGADVDQICRKLEISPATYHKWRNQYGGLKPSEIRQLRHLQRENDRLKKLVAEQALDISLLKEVAKGNF